MIKSVTDYLYISAEKFSNKTAVVLGEDKLTYGEMRNYAEAIASFIIENLYVKKKPIMVFMDKNLYSISCFIGIALSQNIYVPMDTKAPVDRIKSVINILESDYIITDNNNLGKVRNLGTNKDRIFLIDDILDYKININNIARANKDIIDTDPLYIIFTSGSTGVPKGVTISHRAVIDFTEEASDTMGFSDKEIFLSQAPFHFDASVPDIYCTLRNAATVHIVPKQMFSFPIKLLEYMSKNKINAIFWVPSALILVANFRVLGKIDLPELKKVMFCGEVMPAKQLNMWRKAVPDAKYVNYYGPSETTYASTYFIIDREFEDDMPLPIGQAANNTRVLVLNENNEPVGKNEAGELYIQGSGVALGYYNNPEKTKEAFVQNPIHNNYMDIVYKTGDIVKINDNNEIIYVGRKDFQIKHMGYRIELGDIESVANGFNATENSCCIYDKKRNAIVMFIQTKENIDVLKEQLKEKLPEYMVPNKIIVLKKMPLNSNGKIDRKYLQTQI